MTRGEQPRHRDRAKAKLRRSRPPARSRCGARRFAKTAWPAGAFRISSAFCTRGRSRRRINPGGLTCGRTRRALRSNCIAAAGGAKFSRARRAWLKEEPRSYATVRVSRHESGERFDHGVRRTLCEARLKSRCDWTTFLRRAARRTASLDHAHQRAMRNCRRHRRRVATSRPGRARPRGRKGGAWEAPLTLGCLRRKALGASGTSGFGNLSHRDSLVRCSCRAHAASDRPSRGSPYILATVVLSCSQHSAPVHSA